MMTVLSEDQRPDGGTLHVGHWKYSVSSEKGVRVRLPGSYTRHPNSRASLLQVISAGDASHCFSVIGIVEPQTQSTAIGHLQVDQLSP